MEAWSGAVTGMVTTAYDNFFRPNSQSLDNANPITLAYDSDGLLTLAGSLSLTRNSQNGLISQTNLGQVKTSHSYNGFGELAGYSASHNGAALYQSQYSRDVLGRITQKQETVNGASDTTDYAYDTAGRLIEVKKNGTVQASYAYDVNGNRTQLNGQTVASYDDQDRLISYNPSPVVGGGAGERTYTYTDNGELKSITDSTGTTHYTYDVLGNLTQAVLPDGTQIDYQIDGRNRRIGKKVNGTLTQAFLYQGQLKPVAELDGNSQIVARFVYGDKGNVPAYMEKGGATYRLVSDHLGSPRLVINTADGSIAQQLDYDAWGNVLYDSHPGFQPFGFAGGLYDRDTRLTRFGARDYEAETGRWMAKDPIRFGGGDTNLMAYVGNNPINGTDPAGLAVYPPGFVGPLRPGDCYGDAASNTLIPRDERLAQTYIDWSGVIVVERTGLYYAMLPSVQLGVDIHEGVHVGQLSPYAGRGISGAVAARVEYALHGNEMELEAYRAELAYLNEAKSNPAMSELERQELYYAVQRVEHNIAALQ